MFYTQVYVQNFFDGVVARLQHMEDVEYILVWLHVVYNQYEYSLLYWKKNTSVYDHT